MIEEDYVSFETAKLLKEKGFDEKCSHYWQDEISKYSITKEIHKWTDSALANTEISSPKRFSAPTLQMAMKWLRKTHNLHCDIGYDDLDWFWNILNVSESVPVEERPMMIKNGFAGFKSYEEVCETAIKYCLENLI